MPKNLTPIQRIKLAKRQRESQVEQERQEQQRPITTKAPLIPFTHHHHHRLAATTTKSAKNRQHEDDAQEQIQSPSTRSPPKKKLKTIQESSSVPIHSYNYFEASSSPPKFIQSTPIATNLSKPLPVRPLPFPSNHLQQSSLAAKGNNLNEFRNSSSNNNDDDATDDNKEDDLTTRGGEDTETNNDDTDIEHEGNDDNDTEVNQQLPSSIKVQLTLETASGSLGFASPDMMNTTNNNAEHHYHQNHHQHHASSSSRSNLLVNPLSTTLNNAADTTTTTTTSRSSSTNISTPNKHRFRPIRSQGESLKTPPPARSFLQPFAKLMVRQPPPPLPHQAKNGLNHPPALDIYNQFIVSAAAAAAAAAGDDNTGDNKDTTENGTVDKPDSSVFLASSTSSFAPIIPSTTAKKSKVNARLPSHQHPEDDDIGDENGGGDDDAAPIDDDADEDDDSSYIHWRLGNRDIIDWQGTHEICVGLVFYWCLGIVLLYVFGLGAKTVWDAHRLEYQQLHEEYQTLVDILVDTKMQPIPHQFCITQDTTPEASDNKSNNWWLPQRKPIMLLKEVVHSEQSRQSIIQMQQQIVELESERTWWENHANAKEAQLLGFQDQHEQDWQSIMKECSQAMTASMNSNQDEDDPILGDNGSVAASVRQAAYEALDDEFRANGGPMPLELLQEMHQLNRLLDKSNEELMEENLEWQQNMEELYEAYKELQEYRRQDHLQKEAENERFQEEYQALTRQRTSLAHQARQLERKSTEMKSLIQDDARKRLAVWLGEGPIYEVELMLHFQDDDEHTFHYVTVELDGQNMPHSVFTFLSQVELGAYQAQQQQQQRTPTFWFSQVGNNNSVLGLPIGSLIDEWSVEFPSLIFEETSEQISTESYTLGWNGMGPELYIRGMNRNDEGTAQSFQNAPFGRISRGTALVDRMYSAAKLDSSETNNQLLQQLVHPVSLISATIL